MRVPAVVGLGMTVLLGGCGGGTAVVAGSTPTANGSGSGATPSASPTATPVPTDPPAPPSPGATSAASPTPSALPSWATARPRPGVGAAKVVVPRPGMENVHEISWVYAESLDSRTVRIYYYAGIEPCTVLDHVDVAYNSRTIAITLYTGSDPSAADQACAALARATAVDVTLDQPADGRTFVDGDTGKPSAPTKPMGM